MSVDERVAPVSPVAPPTVSVGRKAADRTRRRATVLRTIIVAVVGLVDVATPRAAWRFDRADATAWALTAAGVLVLGVGIGVAIGVVISIGVFLWRASRPHMAVVGRVPGTEHFRNEKRFQVECDPQLLMIRIDERLREKDDIKEFYLGMKDAGVRGERRWKKKKNWR